MTDIGSRYRFMIRVGKELKNKRENHWKILPIINKHLTTPLSGEEVLEILESLDR